MSLAERIAKALGGAKKTSEGYICKCPCHDDRSASLSLADAPKGGLAVNCFAGCRFTDIQERLRTLELLSPPPTRRSGKYDGAKFYIYKDIVGNILARKVKLPSKKMWFERYVGGGPSDIAAWTPGLDGMVLPLYNIQAVSKADIVYLCEGEKDAETLIAAGLCATTNHSGALGWAENLTLQLKGKTIVLIPDNDEAGRKRVRKLSKILGPVARELRVFAISTVKDVTDWVEAGGLPVGILGASTAITTGPLKKKATHDEYYELFDEVLNNPRRCIFNEKLMYQDEASGLWNPAVNALDRLRARAIVANETRDAKYSLNHIQPLFFEYESTKPVEFLVDVPEWDGKDRISAMAYLMKLRPEAGLTEEAFSELLKEWCANVFHRLKNPYHQNRVLVLQGGQGIGKDTWISMLVDGLGQFSIPLSIVKEDKDTYLNLHRGLVMKIAEFDKTAKAEVSTLKDIITTPATNLRAPYDKDSKLRMSRCSFISSANVQNLLRDPTGSRRYMIFEVASIEYAYEDWTKEQVALWQMQCIAQMQHLAEVNYTASADSWRQMREYLDQNTPTEYAEDITEHFLLDIRQELMRPAGEILLQPSDPKVRSVVEKLAKQNGVRFGAAKSMIQSKIGVFKKSSKGKRFWVWVVPALEIDYDPEQPSLEPAGQLPLLPV